jgi:ketosteroid isomerase-like protein
MSFVTEHVIHTYCRAWGAGDLTTLLDCYAEDVVLHWHGRNRLAGSHRGLPAALAALAEFQQRTGRELVEVTDVMVGDGSASIVVFERLGGRVVRRVLVYRVRDGRLAECWVFDEDQRFVDELLA